MILYSKQLLSAGGIPPLPPDADWSYNTVYTTTAVYTAPNNGWRRFHVIGAGGSGGAGGGRYATGDSGPGIIGYGGYGGGSGATGSFAIHAAYMNKGDTANITVSGGTVTLIVNDATIVAPPGGNGTSSSPNINVGTSTRGGTPGAAATGGNIINRAGTAGLAGKVGAGIYQDWNSDGDYIVNSARGGNGANAPINQYTDSPYAYTTSYAVGGKGETTRGNDGGGAIFATSPIPILGQAGAGGSGAGNSGKPKYGYGGKGGSGGVVIEMGW